jgi:hypothetical protein
MAPATVSKARCALPPRIGVGLEVLRLVPEASATALLPPRPGISAVAPTTTLALHLVHVRQDHFEESRERWQPLRWALADGVTVMRRDLGHLRYQPGELAGRWFSR